jgi:hypothetical protein
MKGFYAYVEEENAKLPEPFCSLPLLSLAEPHYEKWELSEPQVKLQHLRALAEALGCEPSSVFDILIDSLIGKAHQDSNRLLGLRLLLDHAAKVSG